MSLLRVTLLVLVALNALAFAEECVLAAQHA